MKPDVLVIVPLRPDQQEQLEATYSLHRYDQADDKEAFLDQIGDKILAAVTNGGRGITRAQLDKLPNLKIVSSSGVGYDAIDVEACSEKGIKVTNTPDVLTDDVADMAVALFLAVRRDLVRGDAHVRSGAWGKDGPYPLTRSIRSKKVGIAGLGRIGKAIAARLEPMGVELAYHGRRQQADVAYHYMADLEAMAKWADVLIAAMPGGADTEGMISANVLEALGPQGSFINIARGSVVDEAALIACLKDGRLGSAGLDVFVNEPNPDVAFAAIPNAVLHPHNASGTVETRGAMSQLVVDNLKAHFAGQPLLTPVN
ncbi:2-hydroxyacid dehydrogenase [uncultured Cohaesibacter sp.]|uniref:2-hydroxyacid dehydrogenase n=1 Tax=uncultured Cohaesibacter sp. TaxID=1002546 RepID=UPI0029C617C8|nr:2-hydroxyacid dehydrogenase [uncultured Cohaesibacter sp.]